MDDDLGKTGTYSQSDFVSAKFDDDRVRVPPDLARAAEFEGKGPIPCFLLAVAPGRYVVIPESKLAKFPAVEDFMDEWAEVGTEQYDLLSKVVSNTRAAIRAQVVQTEIVRMRSGWRIKIPREVRQLVPPTEDTTSVFLLLVGGLIEVWFPDTLRRAFASRMPMGA